MVRYLITNELIRHIQTSHISAQYITNVNTRKKNKMILFHLCFIGNGHFLSIESGDNKNDKRKGSVTYTMTDRIFKCLIFWYYMKGDKIKKFNVLLKRHNEENKEKHSVKIISEGRWIKKYIEMNNYTGEVIEKIILEAELDGPKSCVAVDDIIMTIGSCSSKCKLNIYEATL